MTAISILYEGTDITADVDFTSIPRFVARASGDPGDASIRVLDKHHTYVPGYFHAGGTLELFLDAERVWDGWVMQVRRGWAFDVDNTSNPVATPRYWSIQGFDRNLLFSKRFLYNVAQPADPSGFPDYPAGTYDDVAIADFLSKYVDLTGDDLDTTSGIQHIAPVEELEPFTLGGVGLPWQAMFTDIVGQTGAVYWIGPDRVIHYADDSVATAPFKLVDHLPAAGEVSVRELSWDSDGSALANDALVWGAGRGSEFPTFGRYQNQGSINTYGLWQWSDTFIGMYQQASVERRAQTYVEGSPQHHRGHKDPQDFITCALFEPGLRVGQVVDVTSVVYGKHDVIPVRTVQMSFPTTHDVRYDVVLSHSLDVPFAAVDAWTYPQSYAITETIPLPPLGNPVDIVDPFIDETPFNLPLHTDGIWFHEDIGGIQGDEASNIPPGFGPTHAKYLNIAYNQPPISLQCSYGPPLFNPVGFGGYIGELYSEFWYQIVVPPFWFNDDLPLTPPDVMVRLDTREGQGAGAHAPLRIGLSNQLHPSGLQNLRSARAYGEVGANTEALMGIPFTQLTIGDRQLDVDLVRHFWFVWLVFSPTWPLEDVPFVCDIDYYYPGTGPLQPAVTGQAGSGTIVMPITLQYWTSPGLVGATTDEIVASFRQNIAPWKDGTRVFYTSFPYQSGSLEVWYQGQLLRAGIDFTESLASNGEFTLVLAQDLSGSLQVSYQRFGDAQTNRFYNGNNDGGPNPGDPYNGDSNAPPVPGKSGGKVYRPKPLAQYGWGTVYDGTNCWATGAAMCLDRHSLGHLQHPNHGSPDNTPPAIRFYSGNTGFDGGNHDDQARAWLAGWGQTMVNPGFVPWSYFLHHLNEGRGASIAGLYGVLPSEFRHSATFTGPHEVYCNEQFGDGSFYVIDPLYPRPVLWPYEVMYAYATALSSFGNVIVSFSRITGLI